MSTKPTVTELLERSKAAAKTHQPIPTFAEMGPSGPVPPNCIVNPRCIPENFLNLSMTDGVIVFRNVGGHVTHAITDILALDGFIKVTDILVVHHTDCGTTHFRDPLIREGLKSRLPELAQEIDRMSFGAIDDLKQSVLDDLHILKTSPYIRPELASNCHGFVYDLKTGELTPVTA